jgi:tetratricopeptide (TPR) repeat protein
MTPIEQAIAAHQAGRLGEAETLYRQVLARNPRDFDALHMLGIIHAQRDDYKEAERLLRGALAVDDKVPPCLHNYGNVLSKLERYEEAVAIYNKALALAPDYAPLYSDRGNAQSELGRIDEAMASYHRALAFMPNFPQVFANRGTVLKKLQRDEEALADFDRALALDPTNAAAHSDRGDVLTSLGRLREAAEAYGKAIKIDPKNIRGYFGLAQSMTFGPDEPILARMEALDAKGKGLSKADRIYLGFALGKAYADSKDYPSAFRHFSAANAAKRAGIDYDERENMALFTAIEDVFSADLMAAKSGGGDVSRRPIFILGMPRSGTTLIEQILASHPAVHGGGELKSFGDAVASVCKARTAMAYPEAIPALDRNGITAIGADYLRRVIALAPNAERITDKLPANFLFAGLIHLASPNAVIVHSVRDPVDTCLSCYTNLFGEPQNHTYELGEIGRYYVRYRRLMQHWASILPPGRMLDIHYEDVVADLEGQARRILDHCGLVWDDRCLSFYKTERRVHTVSVSQVRQPIYTNSVKRWLAYEEFLGPLLKELGVSATAQRQA